jgi:hypothetical protein
LDLKKGTNLEGIMREVVVLFSRFVEHGGFVSFQDTFFKNCDSVVKSVQASVYTELLLVYRL